MKCRVCGSELDNRKICQICGTPLRNVLCNDSIKTADDYDATTIMYSPVSDSENNIISYDKKVNTNNDNNQNSANSSINNKISYSYVIPEYKENRKKKISRLKKILIIIAVILLISFTALLFGIYKFYKLQKDYYSELPPFSIIYTDNGNIYNDNLEMIATGTDSESDVLNKKYIIRYDNAGNSYNMYFEDDNGAFIIQGNLHNITNIIYSGNGQYAAYCDKYSYKVWEEDSSIEAGGKYVDKYVYDIYTVNCNGESIKRLSLEGSYSLRYITNEGKICYVDESTGDFYIYYSGEANLIGNSVNSFYINEAEGYCLYIDDKYSLYYKEINSEGENGIIISTDIDEVCNVEKKRHILLH